MNILQAISYYSVVLPNLTILFVRMDRSVTFCPNNSFNFNSIILAVVT